MKTPYKSHRVRTGKPFCQAAGCFLPSYAYIVIRETDEPCRVEIDDNQESPEFDDGFKLILFFCEKHDFEFKYLLNGNELEITKRCILNTASLKVG